jgi:hypothetical protein
MSRTTRIISGIILLIAAQACTVSSPTAPHAQKLSHTRTPVSPEVFVNPGS